MKLERRNYIKKTKKMERIEKYYHNKFEDFEMDSAPDAFSKIMEEVNGPGFISVSGKNTEIKNYSKIPKFLKISISMNVLLITGALVYWASTLRNANDSGSNNSETPVQEIKNHAATSAAQLTASGKENTLKKQKQANFISGTTEQGKPEVSVLSTVDKTDKKEITVDMTNTLTSDTVVSPTNINSEVSEKHPVRKRKIDQYYENQSTKLKDSSNLLFRKK